MDKNQKQPKTLRKRDKKRQKRETKDKERIIKREKVEKKKPFEERRDNQWSESLDQAAKTARTGDGVTVPIGSDMARDLLALAVVDTSSKTVPIETVISQSFIWSFLIPSMSLAYMRGASTEDDASSLTYDALVKLTAYFGEVVQNNVVETNLLPTYMVQYAAAIAQKTGLSKLGVAAYKFLLNDAGTTPPTSILINNHKFFMWVNSTAVTNGFFNQIAPVGGAPRDTWGNWLKYLGDAKSSASLLVDSGSYATLFPKIFRDCSAFAGVYPQFSLPGGISSGISTQIFNPSFIDRPLLSNLVPYQDGGYSFARLFSSSTLHTGLQMLLNSEDRVTKTKVTPNFKYLDFGEFFEIYSIWLAKIKELYCKDKNVTGASVGPYLVTAQEMALMLRQDISWALSPGVLCGEIPYVLPSSTLTPMLFGSNCFPTSISVPMPDVLVENIRALRATTNILSVKKNGVEVPNDKSPCAFTVPILCVGSDLPWTQFWGFLDNTGAVTPLYMPVGTETPIDLIDCSINAGAVAVNINGKVLSDRALILESQLIPLTAYTYTMSKLDQGAPATVLRSLHYTRYIDGFLAQEKGQELRYGTYDPNAPPRPRSGSKKDSEVEYLVMPSQRTVHQGVFGGVGPVTTTSTHPILASVYNNVIQTWWLPVANYALWPAQALTQNEDNRVDTLEKRKNNIAPITSLTAVHDDYVSKFTRAAFADDSSLVTMVKEAAAAGRGGFFSSLLSNVAEQIFPGSKQIIDLLPV